MFFENKSFINLTRCSVFALGLMAAFPVLTGCDMAENSLKLDRAANMEPQDFRDGLAPRMSQDGTNHQAMMNNDAGIPELQPYIAAPPENLKPMPLVSVSVNQTVPLRDALFELAEQAQYDIELDPRITGSIIFTAREKPFDVVIERIADIAGLRYSFNDGSLRVELDMPYNKVYKIDYLSYVRTNSSSIRNDISVVTGQGTNTGSGFEAKGESEANFWQELADNLTQILNVAASTGTLKTAATPQITAADQNPVQVAPTIAQAQPGEDGDLDENGQPIVQVQAPQAVLQVSSLPTDVDNMVDPNAPQQAGQISPNQSSFSVNRQGGMVSVYATERQHKEIQEYLTQLKRSVTAQVLIEAKVLQVDLNDEFITGIDWSRIGGSHSSFEVSVPPANAADRVIELILNDGGNISTVMNAMSRFGTVRALSSPRLTVLNNQSAALNVAENFVYFELTINTSQSDSGTLTTVDSDIRNVPEGVLINVQPSIDLDERSISMAIRPTITSINGGVPDPAVSLQSNGTITSEVPIVNVQEFDSVIKMNSGQAIVMGGLMQDRTETATEGVPVLKEIPVMGALFRNQTDTVHKTELVVFLQATIIDNGTNIHQTDKELYRMFSGDRRPMSNM